MRVYLNGANEDVVTGFRFREDSDGSYELEHKPVGFEWWYELFSGNSDKIGIDGRPIIRQYSSDMGACQRPLVLSGGEF